MIKLLLVDDEPLVLVGLQSMIKWADYGIEICGTARNGSHALELIEQLQPDIVITDIVMPVLDGLKLLQICRKQYGRTPLFIMLTCTEEFGHVKQAMHDQAVDYLVKLELTPEILLQSITKVLDILDSLGKKAVDSFGRQSFYDRFFTDLFNNQFENEAQFYSQMTELGIDLLHHGYTVCYCEIAKFEDNEPDKNMSLYNSTTGMAWETISKYLPCYITNIDLCRFAITLCISEENAQEYQTLLSKILSQTFEIVKKYFNVTVTCCVGVMAHQALSISDSFYTARKALSAPEREYPVHFSQLKSNAGNLVEQVKDYIRRNLDKRLGLNQIAEIFGFSPKYISQIFTKHAGCSFVEYINAEKITKAKELLLSNAKVYEVSEQLGFESSFYFSKVFKKHVGMSPRQYLNKLQKG